MVRQQEQIIELYMEKVKHGISKRSKAARLFLKSCKASVCEYIEESGRFFSYPELVACLGDPLTVAEEFNHLMRHELQEESLRHKKKMFFLGCFFSAILLVILVFMMYLWIEVCFNVPNSYATIEVASFSNY